MIAIIPSLHEFASQWLAAMGRASLYGGIVLALVWIVCRCFPRLPSRHRCWLWRLAFLKMMLCFLFVGTLDLAVLPSSFRAVSLNQPDNIRSDASLPASTTPGFGGTSGGEVLEPVQKPDFHSTRRWPQDDSRGVSDSFLARHDSQAVPTSEPSTSVSVESGPMFPSILFGLWTTVLLVLTGLILTRIVAARHWRRQCILIKNPELLTLVERLSKQFGLVQPPLLFEADFCHSPVVFGAVRTAIVLPKSLIEKMPIAEMQMILAHEMSHIRRGDLLGNWFVSIISGLFFFHPLVWLAFRETRLAQETACDELALGQTGGSIVDYGNLIVDLATRCRQPTSAVVAVGIVESFQKSLKRRISAMKNFGTGSFSATAISWSLVAVVAICLLPWRVVAQAPGKVGFTKATQAEKADDAPRVHVSDTSGKYTVTVDRVRDGYGRKHSRVRSGFSMPMGNLSSNSFSKKTSGGSVSGSSGGGGGGFTGTYMAPNLLLDVKVKGSGYSKGKYLLCELSGKVRANDDLGNNLESAGSCAWWPERFEGMDYPEGSGCTAIHLYRPKASRERASYIRSLEGELLVAEAKRSKVTFQDKELNRETTKSDNGVPVTLTSLTINSDGISLTANTPRLPRDPSASPRECMKRSLASGNRLNVTLEDSNGQIYYPHAVGNAPSSGNASGSGNGTWKTVTSFSNKHESFKKVTSGGGSSTEQQFGFTPMKNGATLKAVHCTVTDILGEPQTVPFHLKEIPLPVK